MSAEPLESTQGAPEPDGTGAVGSRIFRFIAGHRQEGLFHPTQSGGLDLVLEARPFTWYDCDGVGLQQAVRSSRCISQDRTNTGFSRQRNALGLRAAHRFPMGGVRPKGRLILLLRGCFLSPGPSMCVPSGDKLGPHHPKHCVERWDGETGRTCDSTWLVKVMPLLHCIKRRPVSLWCSPTSCGIPGQ